MGGSSNFLRLSSDVLHWKHGMAGTVLLDGINRLRVCYNEPKYI